MNKIKNEDLDNYYNKETGRIELEPDVIIDFIRTDKPIYCKGNLDCEGDLDCEGYLDCKGDLDCEGYLDCKGDLKIRGEFTKKYLRISSNLGYLIIFTDNYIKIGCEYHSIKSWDNFTDREILNMDGKRALDFWKKNKTMIMFIAKS
jgi:hypothetical protein